jgi:hypothetical protein
VICPASYGFFVPDDQDLHHEGNFEAHAPGWRLRACVLSGQLARIAAAVFSYLRPVTRGDASRAAAPLAA